MGMYKSITNNIIDTQETYMRLMTAYYVSYMRGFFDSVYGGKVYGIPTECEPAKPVKKKRK